MTGHVTLSYHHSECDQLMAAKYGSGYTDTGRRGGRWTCQSGLAQRRLANFAAQLSTFTWSLFLLRGDYLGDTEELLGF